MITVECEGDICDSFSCVCCDRSQPQPRESVTAISSQKNPLCVVRACVYVAGLICVHEPTYNPQTGRCKVPAREKYFYRF